ncbi:Hypothetical predicted protein [Olea europaea subsp. europaea]|uniref:Uncharacterized protein n=1 Tax=Olea europaea subsp. europaea TaxID=158383 RepID=A0A8S0TCG2_OLEEU|nr:Hypothetical predicted protein [Olea europaea subsp. europaea]
MDMRRLQRMNKELSIKAEGLVVDDVIEGLRVKQAKTESRVGLLAAENEKMKKEAHLLDLMAVKVEFLPAEPSTPADDAEGSHCGESEVEL